MKRDALPLQSALRFGCRTCEARFPTLRERNDHEDMSDDCQPRTLPCIRCGEEAIEDQDGWAYCSNDLCNNVWTY